MKLIPFNHTWPYEKQMGDIFLPECPYCGEYQVRTNMKEESLQLAKDEVKVRIHMPCCNKTMVVLHADEDYFWTTEVLRKNN